MCEFSGIHIFKIESSALNDECANIFHYNKL